MAPLVNSEVGIRFFTEATTMSPIWALFFFPSTLMHSTSLTPVLSATMSRVVG